MENEKLNRMIRTPKGVEIDDYDLYMEEFIDEAREKCGARAGDEEVRRTNGQALLNSYIGSVPREWKEEFLMDAAVVLALTFLGDKMNWGRKDIAALPDPR